MLTSGTLPKQLARSGAWLFAAGMVTGLWAAVVLTGRVTVPIPRLALAAHLKGILGGIWQVAVAWTCPFLSYGDRGLRRLAMLVAVPAWANWLITLAASVLGVRGLEYTGHGANDTIAALLQL